MRCSAYFLLKLNTDVKEVSACEKLLWMIDRYIDVSSEISKAQSAGELGSCWQIQRDALVNSIARYKLLLLAYSGSW